MKDNPYSWWNQILKCGLRTRSCYDPQHISDPIVHFLFFHYRDLKNNPIITTCLIINSDTGDVISKGVSGPTKGYNKKLQRTIAEGRALCAIRDPKRRGNTFKPETVALFQTAGYLPTAGPCIKMSSKPNWDLLTLREYEAVICSKDQIQQEAWA